MIEDERQSRWSGLFFVLVLCCALLVDSPVQAATLHVASDGSAPYSDLASAAAAAASGDTVRIAAGVYTSLRTYTRPSGTTFEAIVYIPVAELTILGESRDTVILGPADPVPNMELAPVGINQVFEVSTRLVVRGVTVRNTNFGIALFSDGEVSDSRLVHNLHGIDANGAQRILVENCEFVDNTNRGLITFQNVAPNQTHIRDCSFVGNLGGVDFQSKGSMLENCTITGGVVGMQVSLGGDATVTRCTFADNSSVGVGSPSGCSVVLVDNLFVGASDVNVFNDGSVSGTGNILSGGAFTTLQFSARATFDFHGNHILNSGGYSAWMPLGGIDPVRSIDLSDNYWGTADAAQIDAWILDHNDDDRITGQVVYDPYAPRPIPTEKSSIGNLKSRFRN